MRTPLLLTALFLSVQVHAQQVDLAITGVAVLDVENGHFSADQTVLIQGDRITWVGPADEAALPTGAKTVPGAGKFLIPGLWDAHVHLQWDWDAEISLPMFLAHGVTGVRDMASDCREPGVGRPCLSGLQDWRTRIEAGELVGPRLIALSTWPVSNDRQIGGDAEALIDSFVERGVDFVKVLQGLSAEAYLDLMNAAQDRGLPVTGHVPLSIGMIGAATAGQVSIEHARDFMFDGFAGRDEWRRRTRTQNPPTAMLRRMVDEHDPDLVREVSEVMVENQTRYVPTHLTRRFDAFADDEAYRDDPREKYVPAARWDSWNFDAENVILRDPTVEGREALMDFYTMGLEATRVAFASGVEVLAGTDANDSFIFPGSSLHQELEELVKAGMSPAQAIESATLATARFLERDDDFGTIEVGKKADLILLGENPLNDITATQSIDSVLFGGRVFDRADLDELLRGVAAKVSQMNPEVDLVEEQLARFVGAYEASIGEIEVSRTRDALFLRFPGQGRMRLRAFSETEFRFLPREATINFELSESGEVTSLRFRQGGGGGTAQKVR